MPRYKQVSIDSLHEDPKNARVHPERNKAAVRASLEEFGQVEPLVVQAGTGKVVGGNARLAVLREMGAKKVKVSEVEVNDSQATRLGLILNRSAETAEWDDDALTSLLKDLELEGALDGLGWDDDELKILLDDVSVADVKWKEFDETIGNDAPKGKTMTCPHCGESFDA